MILRADHVAGATFVGVGLLILFGAALVLRARESEAFSAIGWNDLPHALQVIAIAAAGIALYTKAGFLLTLFLMIAALLIVIERRNPLRVAIYAASVVVITF